MTSPSTDRPGDSQTASDYGRIKRSLQEALELPEGAVEAWLADLDRREPSLAPHVRRLLDAHRQAGSFLDSPGTPAERSLDTEDATAHPTMPSMRAGRRIGPFTVVRTLGSGGMGTVLLGVREHEGFSHHVAIKVIHRAGPGAGAADRLIGERRILASLNHPGIAHFIDGGTNDDGEPFLAMEYVEGVPITTYCDDHQLSTRDRILLSLKVCEAVQFAHQRLVVHRDIKPSNILVTAAGLPKLLDFGIAKLVDPSNAPAVATQGLLTPHYASPEQAAGGPVTTATDVYSLGVLFYELLTGCGPYRSVTQTSSPLAVIDAIRHEVPEAPSVAAARNGGALDEDLDAIVLKALRKEEGERYGSVQELRDDLSRYVEGLPVRAHNGSRAYRVRKFVARNRAAVVAATLALLSLAVATGVSTYQARVARRERTLAESRFNDLRKLANAVVGPLYDEIAKLPGSTGARQRVVNEALAYLDGLAAQSGGDVDLKAELADAYRKIGDVQGNMYSQNLGDSDGARASYTRLIELRRAVLAARPEDPSARVAVADAVSRLADLDFGTGRLGDAIQRYQQALTEFGTLPAGAGGEPAAVAQTTIRRNLGLALGRAGKSGDADTEFAQAIALIEPLATRAEASDAVRRALMGTRANFGEHLATSGRLGEALRQFETTLSAVRAMSANPADPAQLRYDLYAATNRMTMVLQMMGRADEAFTYFSESMRVLEELARLDPESTRLQFDLATTYYGLSIFERERGRVSAAAQAITKSLALYKATFAKDPTAREFLFNYAGAFGELGDVEAARRRWPEAATAFRQAIAITADPNVNSRRPSERVTFYQRLGDALAAQARQTGSSALVSDARAAYHAARDGYAALEAAGQLVPEYKDYPAQVEEKLRSLGGS